MRSTQRKHSDGVRVTHPFRKIKKWKKKYTCTYVLKHFSFTCKSRLRNVDVNKSVVNDVKGEEKTAQKLID